MASNIGDTGHEGIDRATYKIAAALHLACRVTCSVEDHYGEAIRLRDVIMEGTRELDHQRQLDAVKDGIFPAYQPGPASCPHATVRHTTEWCGCTCKDDEPHVPVVTPSGDGYLVSCPIGCKLGTSAHADSEQVARRRAALHTQTTTPLSKPYPRPAYGQRQPMGDDI